MEKTETEGQVVKKLMSYSGRKASFPTGGKGRFTPTDIQITTNGSFASVVAGMSLKEIEDNLERIYKVSVAIAKLRIKGIGEVNKSV